MIVTSLKHHYRSHLFITNWKHSSATCEWKGNRNRNNSIKAGNRLHGAEIPSDFIIIDDNVFPMYATSFDEPFCPEANSQLGLSTKYVQLL